MSIIPTFELGLWNAWIFMLYLVLSVPVFLHLAKKRESPPPAKSDLPKTETMIICSSKLILIPAFIYSFFLPLKLGTIWFNVGLPINLIGLGLYTLILVNWFSTAPGKPITKGLYRYSRHPMYVAIFIFLSGIAIATASWLFLLVPVIFTAGAVAFIGLEERLTLKEYGDSYKEYMERTPRWLGIPKK